MRLTGVCVGELLDVGTRREGPVAGAGDDDRAAGGVAIEGFEGVGQRRDQREVQGVERGRTIERDERDVLASRRRRRRRPEQGTGSNGSVEAGASVTPLLRVSP